jgi:hypothetical protein
VRWSNNVVLTCISLMTKDAEHFFMYLLAIFLFYWVLLFSLFAHLLIGLVVLLVFKVLSSLYRLNINHLLSE